MIDRTPSGISSPASDLPAEADVLVAGSGAAGLTAALAAASAGARVLLVERDDHLGGTTAVSGGRVWVPCNHCPENAGDTPQAALEYLRALIPDRHARMIDTFVESAPAMARFVESASPHRFVASASYPDYHPSLPGATVGGRCLDMEPADLRQRTPLASLIRVPPGYLPFTHAEWEQWRYPRNFDSALLAERLDAGIRTGGVALVTNLLDGAVRAGVQVVCGARLTAVGADSGGAVTRAEVTDPGGTRQVSVSAVVLATGGYDWDAGLRSAYHPAPQRASGAPLSNSGDGLRIAASLGAATENLDEGWWMPMLSVPGETLDGEPFYRSLIRERGAPRQIIVNAAGARFADEAAPYNEFVKAMHRREDGTYPNDPAYMIFDEGFRKRYPLPGVNADGEPPAWVARGESPRELAARIGVGADRLESTLTRWNALCAQGTDDDFGRGGNPYDRYGGDPEAAPNPNLGPVDEAPYYAVRVLAGTIGTKGGPVTDPDGAVLRPDGSVIAGLYAAGNTSAFWLGDAYPAPGATLAVGMTTGYRAGTHAGQRGAGQAGRGTRP
jgi:succinate dehydrogenase/fumarate reductase flavoprotein subunit